VENRVPSPSGRSRIANAIRPNVGALRRLK
jgi:hypothetical protein